MFGLSGEHLLILAGILLIFGPRKLPELGTSIGKALRNFREGLNQPQNSGQLESHDAPPVVAARSQQATAAPQPVEKSEINSPNPSA